MASEAGFYGAFFGLLAISLMIEVGLGLWILARAGRLIAARFLAAVLVLRPLAILPLFVVLIADLFESLGGGDGRETLFAFAFSWLLFLGAFVPPCEVSFALTYPSTPNWIRRRPAWIVLLFAAPAGLILVALPHLSRSWLSTGGGFVFGLVELENLVLFADIIFVLLAALASLALFRIRARRLNDPGDRARVRFMFRAVALPIAAVAILLLATLATLPALEKAKVIGPAVSVMILEGFVGPAVIATYVLVIPLALGYGILRYRIVDWDRRVRGSLRVAVQYGLISALFVLAFFVVSEAAEAAIRTTTRSSVFGLIGAGALALAVQPLHRWTDRVARRAVRPPTPAETLRRREQLYRATWRDLSTDGRLSGRDRNVLDRLARRLGLEKETVRRLETASRTRRPRRGGKDEVKPSAS